MGCWEEKGKGFSEFHLVFIFSDYPFSNDQFIKKAPSKRFFFVELIYNAYLIIVDVPTFELGK